MTNDGQRDGKGEELGWRMAEWTGAIWGKRRSGANKDNYKRERGREWKDMAGNGERGEGMREGVRLGVGGG